MRFRLSLAESLGKTLAEVDALPIAELGQWEAYHAWREKHPPERKED